MSKETTERRRAAFLAALAETGNITLASEHAAVCRSWVTRLRRRDAEFRAESDAAIDAAHARFSARGDAVPPQGWDAVDGEALTLRGCNRRQIQIARARPGFWTPQKEARFLGILSKCCNVTAACKAIGVSTSSANQRRRLWPKFAERWDQAIAFGTVDLEYSLVENACNFLEGIEPDHDAPIPTTTVEQCIQLLGRYKKSSAAERTRKHWRYQPPRLEDVQASIISKIEAIERFQQKEQNSWIDGGGI